MPDWLDSWTSTRYMSQQALAKRWSNRGSAIADEPPQVMPIEHSKYILAHGKKAYRRWIASGSPDKEAPAVCPVMAMVAQFFVEQRYGVWREKYEKAGIG